MRSKRKEREARWAKESENFKRSGLGGGHMVEVGWIARGIRGQFTHDMRVTNEDARDWLYREAEDDEPKSVRLFMLLPGDSSSAVITTTASPKAEEPE